MATKKDIDECARILRRFGSQMCDAQDVVAYAFADYFSKECPDFNRASFMKKCGL